MLHRSNNGSDERADAVELTTDEYHELLVSKRRRLTIDVLGGNTSSVALDELAAGIVAREEGIDAANEDAVERVAIDLHHVHLPKMDELGLLEYDPDSCRVDPSGVSIDAGYADRVGR
ncbi:DUF7344 domain-containing protein [Natrialbaceae archaeon AArc-T1-2]|uniref:DUF7344 domain-containing protein n=1 Tax=Natrialbaceae archaeon AArc-T1-2 TaxID=3053904 RepID=UPI00255A8CE7|nr:hypothetical protein [Natrialbaceae archaeon AArc-T1-2]WIV66522.1 hypothetical protein QQ977_12585 [Natrialbaceae archaeon AArc-T1-2]